MPRSSQAPKKKSPLRRVLRAIFWATLILLAGLSSLAGVLWYTGMLPQIVVSRVLEELTGGYARVDRPVALIGDKELGGLVIGQTADTPPVIQLRNLVVKAPGGSLVGLPPEAVSMDELIVQLTRDANGDANYDYLLPLLEGKGDQETSPSVAIPSLEIRSLHFLANQAGQTLQVSGLEVSGSYLAPDDFSVTLHGDEAATQWDMGPDRDVRGDAVGPAHVSVTRNTTGFALEARVTLPDFAVADVNALVVQSPAGWLADLTLGASDLYASAWNQIPPRLFPVPVRLDTVHLEDGKMTAAWEDNALSVSALSLAGEARGLSVGEESDLLFNGDLLLTANGSLLPNESIAITAETDDERELRAWIYPQDDQLRATIDTDGLPRVLWERFIPAAYRNFLGYVPNVDNLAATGEATFRDGDITVAGTILPGFKAGDNGAPKVALDLKNSNGTFDLKADWTLGNQTPLNVAVSANSEAWSIATQWDSAHAQKILRAIQDPEALPGIDIGLKGPITIAAKATELPTINMNLNVTLHELPGLKLANAATGKISGEAIIQTSKSALEKGTFSIVVDELGTADLTQARIAGGQSWRVNAIGKITLDAAGRFAGVEGLSGEMAFEGSLEATLDNNLNAPVTLVFEDLRYGNWETPYGEALTLKGDFLFNTGNSAFSGKKVEAVLAGTTLRGETAAIENGSLILGAGGISSDLGLLVTMGYVDEATGTLTAEFSKLTAGAAGFLVEGKTNVVAEFLSADDGLAKFENLVFDGTFAPGKSGLHGSGPVTAGKITSGGAVLTDVSAMLDLQGEDATLKDFKTTIFSGSITGEIELDPFAEGFPVTLDGDLQNVDLADFTLQMEPPNVSLTGKVNGRVVIGLRGGELVELDIDLTAGDGLTMNRSLVEQILLSQDFSQMTGGKSIEKVIKKVLGDAPQRPFKDARITLGLVDGRIAGVALLESEGLNLTVDITADPEAILAALRDVR